MTTNASTLKPRMLCLRESPARKPSTRGQANDQDFPHLYVICNARVKKCAVWIDRVVGRHDVGDGGPNPSSARGLQVARINKRPIRHGVARLKGWRSGENDVTSLAFHQALRFSSATMIHHWCVSMVMFPYVSFSIYDIAVRKLVVGLSGCDALVHAVLWSDHYQ